MSKTLRKLWVPGRLDREQKNLEPGPRFPPRGENRAPSEDVFAIHRAAVGNQWGCLRIVRITPRYDAMRSDPCA